MAEVQTTNQITGSRRWWALGAVMLTMFFGSLDQTVISTAMPVIIGDLQGFELYAWVFTAYMVTSAVTVPIYGKLSDVYGRRPFYVWGLGLFILSSVAAGFSSTMLQLVLARAVQGIGAGAMMSMPRATVGDIFNPRERGRWMGLIAAVFGLSSLIGPVLGGWITDHWGWQWVFFINLPVAGTALIAVWYTLPKVKTDHTVQVDWWGSALLPLALVPALLAFTWVGSEPAWTSPQIMGLLFVSAVALLLFWWVEQRAAEPILAPDLFRNSIFTMSVILGILVSVGMFGIVMFLPVFVQGVMGVSAEDSGLILIPMMLSFIVGSTISGQLLSRTGRYRTQAHVGAALMVIGAWLFSRMGVQTPWQEVVRNMTIMGIGVGSLMPLLNVAVQNAFPYRLMGMVNATQQFAQSLGGVVAGPILGAVLTRTFSSEMTPRLPAEVAQAAAQVGGGTASVDPQSLINAQTQAALQARFEALGPQGLELYGQFIEVVRGALTAGMHELFTVGLVFAVLALAGTFFLREIRLKQDEYYTGEASGGRSDQEAPHFQTPHSRIGLEGAKGGD